MKKMLVISSLILSVASFAGTKVIYGEDNRKDLFESTNELHKSLAHSAAAQVANANLSMTMDGDVQVVGQTLRQRNICAKERFSSQVSAARCSGFLVGSDLLVTAGHCVKDQNDCANYSWVFDFQMNDANQTSMRVEKSAVYKCKSIVARALDNATQNDFALLKLDRVASDRQPLSVRREGKVADNTPIVVIGVPSGIPLKISDGAVVRGNTNPYFFVANLDTYGGNSGSAVFDSNTGLVEGILVRGEQDYVYDYAQGCSVSKVCDMNGCRGEDVTRITQVTKYFGKYLE